MIIPKISVIVPVYNVEEYLRDCLDSLINQTFKDIEIICIDDCGTDNSMDIVNEYIKRDSRIKIVTHKQNKGLGEARNSGIAVANGEYIMNCDSDDYYELSMCERIYETIIKEKSDLAICGMNTVYEMVVSQSLIDSDLAYYSVKHEGTLNMNFDIMINIDCSSCNKIFKRSIIDKYDIKYINTLYEDANFFMKYIVLCKKVSFLQDKLYNYRRREKSIMSNTFNKSDKVIDHLLILDDVNKFYEKRKLYSKKLVRDYFMNRYNSFLYFTINYSIDPYKVLALHNELCNSIRFMKNNKIKYNILYIFYKLLNTITLGLFRSLREKKEKYKFFNREYKV